MTDNGRVVVIWGAATLSGSSTAQETISLLANPASSPLKLEIKENPLPLSHSGQVAGLQFSIVDILKVKNIHFVLF